VVVHCVEGGAMVNAWVVVGVARSARAASFMVQ
jgi:hypothetical protein